MAVIGARCLAAPLLAGLLAVPSAHAVDLVVYHGWAAPAELAALNVLREALETRGHGWRPLSIPHDADGGMDAIELIAAGATPNVFLHLQPDIYRRLDAAGLLLHLDAQFAENGLLPQLPDVVRAAITVDGAIVKVPATLHADAMIYYNRAVAAAAGIDPMGWASLEAMWADFPKVRAAGFEPLALSGQSWQVGYLTHGLVASLGGPGVYEGLYGHEVDPAVFDDPSLLTVFAWLRRFQQEADPNAGLREWNMATSRVIRGQALLQLHGDWMKGEWLAAGKAEGDDYGCRFVPGAAHVPVTVDGWGLLGGVDAATEAAEREFAELMVDPAIQRRFAAAKGSTPVRRDSLGATDGCSQLVVEALEREGFALPTPRATAAPGWVEAVWAVASAFWNDPTMSPEAATAGLEAAFAGQHQGVGG